MTLTTANCSLLIFLNFRPVFSQSESCRFIGQSFFIYHLSFVNDKCFFLHLCRPRDMLQKPLSIAISPPLSICFHWSILLESTVLIFLFYLYLLHLLLQLPFKMTIQSNQKHQICHLVSLITAVLHTSWTIQLYCSIVLLHADLQKVLAASLNCHIQIIATHYIGL